jgi:hypothetical protein
MSACDNSEGLGDSYRTKDSFMHIASSAKLAAATVLAIFAFTLLVSGQSVEGAWDATVTVNNVSIPFRIEIDGTGADVHSYFFNGDDRVNPSNSGTFQNGSLVLNFDSYATKLGDAPPCQFCGSLMVRNGSCYRCMTCGSTSGCS